MKKENLGFVNLYKFLGSIVIACFLHYNVLFLGMFQYSYNGASRVARFLMNGTSNYVVELFFILSGLMFAYAYQDRIESGELPFANFFDKRLKRFMPLTIITTFVMFFLRILLEKVTGLAFFPGNVSVNELIYSLILCNSTLCRVRINPAAWYIANLLVCYVLAYILSKYHKNLGKITFVIPIIVGALIRIREVEYPFFELHMSRGYIAFFVGVILCSMIRTLEICVKSEFAVIGGISVIVLLFALHRYVNDWLMASTIILFPAFIIVGYFSRILNKIGGGVSAFKYLGRISFDIYLWNSPILVVIAVMHHYLGFAVDTGLFVLALIVIHIVVGCISDWGMKKWEAE